MSAPERIWALCDRRKHWQDEPPQEGQHPWHWTEYVRAKDADAALTTAEMDCRSYKAMAADAIHRMDALTARIRELEGALRDMVPPELKWRERGPTCLITHPTEVIRAARAALKGGAA